MQHISQDHWRCKIGDCSTLFLNLDIIERHLDDAHQVKEPDRLRMLTMKRRVEDGLRTVYWCGFCKDVLITGGNGIEGANERSGHIDNQILKEKKEHSAVGSVGK